MARDLFEHLTKRSYMERYTANLALNHPWITRIKGKIPMTHLETMRDYQDRLNLKTLCSMMVLFGRISQESNRYIKEKYLNILNGIEETPDEEFTQVLKSNSMVLPCERASSRANSRNTNTSSLLSVPIGKNSRAKSGSPSDDTRRSLVLSRVSSRVPNYEKNFRKTRSPLPRSPNAIAPFRDTKLS